MNELNIRPAGPEDSATIYGFIMKMARYEKLESEVDTTEQALRKSLFEERQAEVVLGELNGRPVGFALFFHNFSTFRGQRGLYLEDIYVDEEYRGRGYGKRLLIHLVKLAAERRCRRMEWVVLDWNAPSIAFYRSLGAVRWTMDGFPPDRRQNQRTGRRADGAGRPETGSVARTSKGITGIKKQMQSMVINERECRKETVAEVARQIMIAGRTAPKGKGIDLIEIVAVTGETIEALAEATRLASEQTGMKFFLRDAENIRQADAVILVGTRLQSLSLNCGYCGYPTCEKKNGHPAAPCALNMVDLGIAIGSMTAKAADLRVDNRVMFSAGKAAPSIGLLAGCHSIYAIPLSVSSKNPFFDRASTR